MPASRQSSTTTACLTQVLGDFNETLQGCFQLLDDKSVYATQQGFLYNIQWYIRVKDDVEQLRDRIAFLNIKVSVFLTVSLCGANCLEVVHRAQVFGYVSLLTVAS